MRYLTTILIAIFSSINCYTQTFNVKDLEGSNINMNELMKSNRGAVLYFTFNPYSCNICSELLDEFKKNYKTLTNNRDFKIIAINTLSNKVYNSESFKNEYGKYDIIEFTKYYAKTKNWPFEILIDDQETFIKALGIKDGDPIALLTINSEYKFFMQGFYIPEDDTNGDRTLESTYVIYKDIINSIWAKETFFDENWYLTLKKNNPSYRRTTRKLSNGLYEVKDYWITGELQMLATYKDALATIYHDEVKWYHKNGRLLRSTFYKDGKRDGNHKEVYDNGQLKNIGKYVNGKANGEHKKYHKNGKLKQILKYVNGKAEGEIKVFFENGQLGQIANYINGKLEGEYKIYDENGKLKEIGNFVNGKAKKRKIETNNPPKK